MNTGNVPRIVTVQARCVLGAFDVLHMFHHVKTSWESLRFLYHFVHQFQTATNQLYATLLAKVVSLHTTTLDVSPLLKRDYP
jgi:hypothetical protein